MSITSFILGITGLSHELDLVKSGLQFCVSIGELSAWAAKSENVACLIDCASVAELWLTEATDEAGVISTGALTAILTDGDPFAGSRRLAETVLAKYPGFQTKAAIVAAKKVATPSAPVLTATATIPDEAFTETAPGEAMTPQ
jgi:hypothetical protein